MNFSLSKIWEQIKEQYAKMSKRVKIAIFVTLGVIVAASLVVAMVLNNKPYETLFTGLNAQETSEVLGKLQELGVDYKFDKDNTIKVPREEEPRVKALLVSQGYPKSGLSYDIFKENINLMSTDFEKNAYKLYDLQNRIESTIRMFDGVLSATVNISLPEEQKYVLQQDKTAATASVHVTMANGGSPTADQVKAIVTLVSTSIAGLERENVGVTDSSGKVLTDSSGDALLGATQLKMALENEIEASIKNKLVNLLAPIYGDDNVRVSVLSSVDVDKKIREIINYIPNNNDRGVISTEGRGVEAVENGETVGGVVGTETNAEIPNYPNITVDGNEVYFQNREDINYLVSQIKEQIQSDAGVLTDLSVSVAIGNVRPDELQVEEVKKLIAVTAGIDTAIIDDKVAIYYSPFVTGQEQETAGPEGIFASPYIFWIICGASALVTILLIIVMIVLLKKRKTEEEGEGEEEELTVDGLQPVTEIGTEEDFSDINLHEIKTTREQELKKQIGDFADENPEISAQLIRTWLKGEEG